MLTQELSRRGSQGLLSYRQTYLDVLQHSKATPSGSELSSAFAEALIKELESLLAEPVDSLASLTGALSLRSEVSSKADATELPSMRDRLQTLLEAYDGEAGELILEIESQVARTDSAQPIQALAGLTDEYQFDKALEHLNALIEDVRSSKTDSAALP